MKKLVGRLVARDNVAGIFIPIGDGPKLDGLYDIYEIMGELCVKRVGTPAMKREQFIGLDLDGLMNIRPLSVMTQDELDNAKSF